MRGVPTETVVRAPGLSKPSFVLQWGVRNHTDTASSARPPTSPRGTRYTIPHKGSPAGFSTSYAALRAEVAWLGQGLRRPGLYGCLLGALALWALAWQVRAPYGLDLGGPAAGPYVFHFYAREPDPKVVSNPPFTYRWSEGTSQIRWPGVGDAPVTVTLRLAGGRAGGAPPAGVTVTIRGQTFPVALTNDRRDYAFPAGRGDAWRGDLVVDIQAPTSRVPPDPRRLGILVERASVTPRAADGGAFVVPPGADLARWAAALAVLWLLAWRLSGHAAFATALGAGGAAAVALGAVTVRPDLGLLAAEAPVLLLWAYPLAVAGRLAAGGVLRLAPHPTLSPAGARGGPSVLDEPPGARTLTLPSPPQGEGRVRVGAAEAAAGALVLGFLLRVGGMVYPQFLTSDIGLHVNNLGKVLNGTWVWIGALPNGAPQPYPPLPYLALAPFAGLVPDLSLLLRAGVGLLDALCVLPLLYLGARLGGARAGATAGWVYALLPASFVLFSAGVFAYLFAAAVFTWTLAGWGATLLARRPRPGPLAALSIAFFLTFLSAYGMLIAATAVAGLFVLLALAWGPADLRRRALLVAGTLLVAGVAAYAVYYWRFSALLLAPTGGVSAKVALPAATPAALMDLLGRRLGPALGWPAVLAALAGWGAVAGRARGIGVLVLATTLAGLAFAALSLVVGENIRYPLLFAPLAAVGSGLFLSRLGARGPAGRGWSAAILGLLFWHLLAVWIPLILTAYH